MRLAERAGVCSRGLFWAMMLAIGVSIVASVWVTLLLAYRYGGANLNRWFFLDGPQFPYKWVAGKMNNPSDPSIAGWLLTGFGAAVMGFSKRHASAVCRLALPPCGLLRGQHVDYGRNLAHLLHRLAGQVSHPAIRRVAVVPFVATFLSGAHRRAVYLQRLLARHGLLQRRKGQPDILDMSCGRIHMVKV
jgi:hypothetical protein